MQLTNYEHACFTLEKDGQLLVVDPGNFTTDLGAPENVVAIVVTHEHGDHFDSAALGALIGHNPQAVIYGPEAVTRQLGDTLPHHAVEPGQTVTAGPFTLSFFGGDHAVIHPSLPGITNVGVLIDDVVYYPGDSFVAPGRNVEMLALPVAAPWLKVSDVMDFLTTIRPRLAFPTHDAILSAAGKAVVDRLLTAHAAQHNLQYRRLDQPLEVS